MTNMNVKFVGVSFVLKMHVTDTFRKFLVTILINQIRFTVYNDELLRKSNQIAQNFVQSNYMRHKQFPKTAILEISMISEMYFYNTIPIYTILIFTGYTNNICLNTGLNFDVKHTILLTPFYTFLKIPFVSERKFLSVTARSNIRYQYINKTNRSNVLIFI